MSSYSDDFSPETPSVLIVEQEPAVLVILSSLFRRSGFRTLLARSAAEAVEIASRPYVPVDSVLTDVEVMGEPGPQLVEGLQRTRPDVPVLFMSAVTDSGAVRINLMRQLGPKYFVRAADTSLASTSLANTSLANTSLVDAVRSSMLTAGFQSCV